MELNADFTTCAVEHRQIFHGPPADPTNTTSGVKD